MRIKFNYNESIDDSVVCTYVMYYTYIQDVDVIMYVCMYGKAVLQMNTKLICTYVVLCLYTVCNTIDTLILYIDKVQRSRILTFQIKQ